MQIGNQRRDTPSRLSKLALTVAQSLRANTSVALIAVNIALCLALAWMHPLAAELNFPRNNWAKQADVNPVYLIAHIVIYLLLWLVWVFALRNFQTFQPSNKIIWLGWLLPSLALLFTFPGESGDVFDYIFRGRMMTEHGASPLYRLPKEFTDAPFHRYVSWDEWVDAYGPLWEYASAATSWLVQLQASPSDLAVIDNQTCRKQSAVCAYLIDHITAYRLFAIAMVGLCGWLIFKISRSHSEFVEGSKVERNVSSLAFVALWLWNPLVLISSSVGAHNDAFMLAFVLLALFCFKRDRWLLGVLSLFAAAHIKMTALILLPAFLVWLIVRRGWKKAFISALCAIAIALPVSYLLYLPLGGWGTLPRNFFERGLLSTNSLGELIYLALRLGVGWYRFESQQAAARIASLVFVGVSGLYLLYWLLGSRRKNLRDTEFARLCLTVTMIYLVVGSFWFQAWYLMLPIALAAIKDNNFAESPPGLALPTLCASAMIAVLLSDFLRAISPPILEGWQVSALVVAMILLPAVCVVVVRKGKAFRRLGK